MRVRRILRYTCVTLSSLLLCAVSWAQEPKKPAANPDRVRGVQFSSREEAAAAQRKAAQPLFAGASVSVDLVGAVMKVAGSYGQLEAAGRINLKNKFFPIVEVGLGSSDHTNKETNLHYKTSAPYFRIGCDYNFLKDRTSGNRVFGGLRYAFTSFNFDLDGPNIVDPVWHTDIPFSYKSQNASFHWAELVFGLEAKIWGNFHIGWSGRYRIRLHQSNPAVGQAWYVPGFGKNDNHVLGGTFNLIFDI